MNVEEILGYLEKIDNAIMLGNLVTARALLNTLDGRLRVVGVTEEKEVAPHGY